MERRWPCFKETDGVAQTTSVNWGDYRFGRIPSFVWEDTGPDYSAMQSSAPQTWEQDERSSPLVPNMLRDDAHTYEQHFARALQENLKCAQHHIHPKKGASQERTIPNACLSTRSGKECKASFPMDARVDLSCEGMLKNRRHEDKHALHH